MSSTVVLNLLDAVYVADARDLAEVLLKTREVAQVNGLDDEVDVDGAIGGGARFDAADVGAVVGDDGCELLEETGAVVDREGQFDGVGRRPGPGGVLAVPCVSDHSTSMRRSAS